MSRVSTSSVISFSGAAAALGAAAVVAWVACPGGCATCTSCTTTIVPTTASMLAVGGALFGSHAAKKRAAKDAGAPEPDSTS